MATRVVANLEELGLVQRAAASTDGRVSVIELSDAGRQTLIELWSERAAGLTARIERLQPDQAATLRLRCLCSKRSSGTIGNRAFAQRQRSRHIRLALSNSSPKGSSESLSAM